MRNGFLATVTILVTALLASAAAITRAACVLLQVPKRRPTGRFSGAGLVVRHT
jgi:hypothetical protein